MAKSVKRPSGDPLVAGVKKFVRKLQDPKARLVLAVVTLALSIYVALAFVSYLWTWDVDQSKLSVSGTELLDRDTIQVENWGGMQGALLADLWIRQWFGLTSFALIFVLFVASFRMIRLRLVSLSSALKYTAIGMMWGAVALAFVFGELSFGLGGRYGAVLSSWLMAFLGSVGTSFVLVISLFGFLVFAFDNSLLWMRWAWAKLSKSDELESLSQQLNVKPKAEKQPVNTEAEPQIEVEEEDPTWEVSERKQTEKSTAKDNDPEMQIAKNEFMLHDDGVEEDLLKPANDLGFEVDVTVTADEEIIDETDATQENETAYLEQLSLPMQAVEAANRDSGADAGERQNITLRVQKNEDVIADEISQEMGEYDPTLDLPNYQFPPLDILEDHKIANSEVTNEELLSNKNKIVETLRNFKIEIEKIKAVVGPTVTLYEIIPAPGVRISKIKNLEDDIALSLAALGIRIIAPMPGRGTIGIEVPNQKPKVVSMRSVISSSRYQETKYELPIALGKNISNETYVADLAKMPHLLVAGATGQGKSVGINVILTSLLYKKHPSQLKFVLVDPKKVELNIYDKIKKHYLAQLPDTEEPIITDNSIVINTLNSLNVEMDNRYQMLKKAGVRNIKEYNAKFVARQLNPNNGHEYLPYIVLVIDEFADLIMTAGKEVELPIARLAQLARAVGIHLIVATQRPSTNIITGVIKANFPTRLAFKVASMIDSRTILDAPGANQLIGRGDMLISEGSELVRLQCAFVDTPEVDRLVNHVGSQKGYPEPFILPEVPRDSEDELKDIDLSKRDELFEDAARLIVIHQQGSTSLIQRKLAIGYNRAGRIVDQLEAAGIIGPFEGSKARQVLYSDEYSLEQYLSSLSQRNA